MKAKFFIQLSCIYEEKNRHKKESKKKAGCKKFGSLRKEKTGIDGAFFR